MKKIIICNHKMFLDTSSAKILSEQMKDIDITGINLIVCPSYINFGLFRDYNLCAQDCFYEDKGPYTGEISCIQLKENGIAYSLVGHSYRRNYDSNNIINLKIKSLLKNDMTPVLCIGEYNKNLFFKINKKLLKKQLKESLVGISLSNNKEIIVAYEPKWTIGTGEILTKKELDRALKYIKSVLDKININNYKLLYGGSINEKNIYELDNDNLDGYLLGGSSVDVKQLKNIVKYTKKCK